MLAEIIYYHAIVEIRMNVLYMDKMFYKYVAWTSINPDKTYLGTAEGNFKKRYDNHTKLIRHKRYISDTTLSSKRKKK